LANSPWYEHSRLRVSSSRAELGVRLRAVAPAVSADEGCTFARAAACAAFSAAAAAAAARAAAAAARPPRSRVPNGTSVGPESAAAVPAAAAPVAAVLAAAALAARALAWRVVGGASSVCDGGEGDWYSSEAEQS
jgi:hypothetical protein